MESKNYKQDISSVTTPVKFHLPDGSSQSFKTSTEALQWFNQNYGNGYNMVEYVPTLGDSEHPIQLQEVTVTAQAPKQNKHFHGTSDFDALFGKSRVEAVRKAWLRNPRAMLNWTDGGNAAAAFVTAPFVAHAAGEYALPWLAENVVPYLSANGWLGVTQAAGNTPAWLTPTSATAIDAALAGSATGASINDMRENGPTIENILGTALGVGGLAYEAAPTIKEGYIATRNALRPAIVGMNMPLRLVETAEIPLNIGWGPRQTLSVTHKSDKATPLSLYNELRWDVINEGANPLGIWFLGKLGIPRTFNTGATTTLALKAVETRRLFARRPYTHSGDLTLNKPIVTIGDVPNRSILSYRAELMGADGLIYNDVYDNGYNANLVILSFKLPENYMLTARAYKGGLRKSPDYEFFTTDPKYARNYGAVKPYYITSKFPVVTDKPLMGYSDPVERDMFINDISGNKPVDAIIGHDKITGEFPYTSHGDEILIFNPSLARLVDQSPKLTLLEKLGVPKIERNFRIHGHDYSNPVDYGELFLQKVVNPESPMFGSFINDGSKSVVFLDPDNPNMVLKVNTDWKGGSLLDFFNNYVKKRNKIPFLKPLIIRGKTLEGFPVVNLEKVIPMTYELYIQNLPKIKEMLYLKGFVGNLDWGYISNGDMSIGDFNPGNVAFDSKGNIVFIDIDAYKQGGKLE